MGGQIRVRLIDKAICPVVKVRFLFTFNDKPLGNLTRILLNFAKQQT